MKPGSDEDQCDPDDRQNDPQAGDGRPTVALVDEHVEQFDQQRRIKKQ
jgi:hypothetical protein